MSQIPSPYVITVSQHSYAYTVLEQNSVFYDSCTILYSSQIHKTLLNFVPKNVSSIPLTLLA